VDEKFVISRIYNFSYNFKTIKPQKPIGKIENNPPALNHNPHSSAPEFPWRWLSRPIWADALRG
jgi:hypothetical protein